MGISPVTEWFQLPHLVPDEPGLPGWDFWGPGEKGPGEDLRALSREQSLPGPRTSLGGMGRLLLGPLGMWRFPLDISPSDPSCLFYKKEPSLTVEFGGTGGLPPIHSEGAAWGGGRQLV